MPPRSSCATHSNSLPHHSTQNTSWPLPFTPMATLAKPCLSLTRSPPPVRKTPPRSPTSASLSCSRVMLSEQFPCICALSSSTPIAERYAKIWASPTCSRPTSTMPLSSSERVSPSNPTTPNSTTILASPSSSRTTYPLQSQRSSRPQSWTHNFLTLPTRSASSTCRQAAFPSHKSNWKRPSPCVRITATPVPSSAMTTNKMTPQRKRTQPSFS